MPPGLPSVPGPAKTRFMLAWLRPTWLDRYIFRQLTTGLALVTGGLVALVWMTQSLRFVPLIIQHGLSPMVFIHLTGLLLPSFFAVVLPITCFIVTLFVYSRLATDRELTVMRATGRSDLAIARPALAVALLTLLVCMALNIWLVPSSLATFSKFEMQIRNKVAAFLLEPGVFNPVSAHIIVYVQRRSPGGVLHGIIIDDERQKGQPATILARSGRLVKGPDGPMVELRDGERQQVDPRTHRLNVLSFTSDLIDIAQASKTARNLPPKTSEASMAQLLHPDAQLIDSATRHKWRAEITRRLAAPFAVLSYALIALLAVLRAKFRRHGGFVAPAAAVVAVVVLVALGVTVQNLAARDNALIPLIWLVALGPSIIIAAWSISGRGHGIRPAGEPAR